MSELNLKAADDSDPSAILGALDAVVYDWDVATDRLGWGPTAAGALRDLPRAALATGEGYAGLVTADSEASRYLAVFNGLASDDGQGASFRARYRLAGARGETLEIEDFGRWFADAEGRPCRVHGLVRVLSRASQAAPSEANSDGADKTLCTRRAFNAWVDEKCAEARGPDCAHALMVVALSDLTGLNRREGYDVADELILAIGRRLAQGLRAGDKLVRYAGGKFALFLALSPHDPPAVAAARMLRRAADDPYPVSVGAMRAKIRIGVALTPRHGRNAHLLLQHADEALAQTSSAGEEVAVFEADEALSEIRRRDAWIGDEIVAALNERRILLAFQPIVPTRPGLPPFDEALLRLRLDDGTFLGPDALIPAAERLGLVQLIDERVLELTIQTLAADPNRRLSMNVSIAALRSAEWFERLCDHLKSTPAAAERLTLEILETQAIDDVEEAKRILERVKALGVRVAMDDFGAGYTSFRNLRGLGIDMVKIDGAFVQNLASSIDDRFFVRTLASLARHLGIVTVAEWVQDEEFAELLGDWGVDYVQGNHIGGAATSATGAAQTQARATA